MISYVNPQLSRNLGNTYNKASYLKNPNLCYSVHLGTRKGVLLVPSLFSIQKLTNTAIQLVNTTHQPTTQILTETS